MVPANTLADGESAPPATRRGVRRRKPKVDPDYVPSAGCARNRQQSARRSTAVTQPQQVKLRLRRVKPGIQKTRLGQIKGKSEDVPSSERIDDGEDTSMHFAEATQGNAGDVQLCIWQLMAAYCLPPRKRRRHRLEGDLDYLAATQYCHSALSTM